MRARITMRYAVYCPDVMLCTVWCIAQCMLPSYSYSSDHMSLEIPTRFTTYQLPHVSAANSSERQGQDAAKERISTVCKNTRRTA
jgi:hypothetical protein